MKRNVFRLGLLGTVIALVFSGCASEEWDSPRDPAGDAYVACPGVSEDLAGACLFYDEFAGSLSRWFLAGASLPDIRTVEIDGQSSRAAVLQACSSADSGALFIEIEVPDEPLFLTIRWAVEEESPAARPGVSVDGRALVAAPAPAKDNGWYQSFEDIEATSSGRIQLRLYNRVEEGGECSALLVDSVLVETVH